LKNLQAGEIKFVSQVFQAKVVFKAGLLLENLQG
jgi:hypothetical protein